jgi:hypothetical protein
VALATIIIFISIRGAGNSTVINLASVSARTGSGEKQTVAEFPIMKKDAATGNTLWGFIDGSGNTVIEPKYDQVNDFDEYGYSVVTKGQSVGLIDKDGNEVLPVEYTKISEYADGFRIGIKDSVGYVFDTTMKCVYGKTGVNIGGYGDGLFSFSQSVGSGTAAKVLWGYMDTNFNVVITPQYLQATDFQNGKTVVANTDKQSVLIDKTGAELFKSKTQLTYDGIDSLISKDDLTSKVAIMDLSGKILVDYKYTGISGGADGQYVVYTDKTDATGKCGLIDRSGKTIIPEDYFQIDYKGGGLYAVYPNSDFYSKRNYPAAMRKLALFSTEGKKLTDYLYYDCGMSKDKKTFYVTAADSSYFVDSSAKKINTLPTVEGQYGAKLFIDRDVVRLLSSDRLFYTNKAGKIFWDSNSPVVPDGLTSETGTMTSVYDVINEVYTISYPQMKFASADVAAAVNATIKKAANAYIDPATFDGNVLVRKANVFVTKNVMTLTFFDTYYEAVKYTVTKSLRHSLQIDIQNGNEYLLKDLFKPNSQYLSAIQTICNKYVDDYNKTDAAKSGKLKYPIVTETSNFFMASDSVHLYFNPSEISDSPITTYPEVTVPFTDVDQYINKDGAFWKALN